MAQIDPRSFGDPLALRTQWGPLFRPGAVPLGRPGWYLHEASTARLELRRALSPLPIVVFLGPALLAGGPLALKLAATGPAALSLAGGVVVALLWLALGLWLLRPAVFDRDRGAFWIGWFAPARPGDGGSCALNQIHALQLLRLEAEVRQQRRPTRQLACYQLNLVLLDAQRRCVAMSLDLAQLRGDAAKLQRFLSSRMWDGTGAAATVAGATNTARAMDAPARRPAPLGVAAGAEPRRSPLATMALLATFALGVWLLAHSDPLAQLAEQYRRLLGAAPAQPATPIAPAPATPLSLPARSAALASPPTRAHVAGNLLADPSLESGSGEWYVHDRGSDARGAWSADAAATGGHALLLQASRAGGAGWPGWLSRSRFKLDRTGRYVLRAKSMTPDGAAAWLEAGYFDARGDWLGSSSSGCLRAVPPHGDWRELEHPVSPESFPGAVEVQLGLRQCLTFTEGQPTSLFFDDVYFGVAERAESPAAAANVPPAPPAAARPGPGADPTELAQCANVALERRAQCAFSFFVAQACRGETAPAANAACRARERAKYGAPEP